MNKIIRLFKNKLANYFLRGPLIVFKVRFGQPYSLSWGYQRKLMISKIERNSAKMGYENFKEAITRQKNEAEKALIEKMKKWYTLEKQVEFLKSWRPHGE